jgi:hypothetical protein
LFCLPPAPGERHHQEVQALKNRIVQRAARIHDEAGGPALYVGVFFRPGAVLTKRTENYVAQQIARAVLRASLAVGQQEGDVHIPVQFLPADVIHISVGRSVNGTDKLWHADAGGWVTPILPDHIENAMARKIRNHQAARTRCDELWLVIVNDVFSLAAQAELAPGTSAAAFTHPFDRLLWLIPHKDTVLALGRTHAPGHCYV